MHERLNQQRKKKNLISKGEREKRQRACARTHTRSRSLISAQLENSRQTKAKVEWTSGTRCASTEQSEKKPLRDLAQHSRRQRGNGTRDHSGRLLRWIWIVYPNGDPVHRLLAFVFGSLSVSSRRSFTFYFCFVFVCECIFFVYEWQLFFFFVAPKMFIAFGIGPFSMPTRNGGFGNQTIRLQMRSEGDEKRPNSSHDFGVAGASWWPRRPPRLDHRTIQ